MTRGDMLEKVARAICNTGRLETGEGTCAAICLDQLGSARPKCQHVVRVHKVLAQAALDAIGESHVVVPKKPTLAMRRAGWETLRELENQPDACWKAMLSASQETSDG